MPVYSQASKTPFIKLEDKLVLNQKIASEASQQIDKFIKSIGLTTNNPPLVTVEMTFDDFLLAKDAQAFFDKTQQEQAKLLEAHYQSQVGKLLALKKRLSTGGSSENRNDTDSISSSSGSKSKASVEGIKNKVRFGLLNIDITQGDMESILEGSLDDMNTPSYFTQPQGEVNLSFSMPQTTPIISAEFEYDPARYIKSISLVVLSEVSLIEDRKSELENVLKTFIKNLIGKESFEFTLDYRQLSLAQQSWIEGFIQPNNSGFATLVAALLLGVFGLISIMLLGKVFKLLARNILELKPAEEGVDAATIDASWEESGDDSDDSEDQAYDPTIAAQALTADMKTIRDELAKIVTEIPQVVAELLRDYFYSQSTLSDFRDLLTFAGYRALKPAMDLLPNSSIEDLKAYIEENKDKAPSLLKGVEVAQNLYQEAVSTLYGNDEKSQELNTLREKVLTLHDEVIADYVSELNAQEIAILLDIFTIERGNRFVANLPKEKLKEAYEYLDKNLASDLGLVQALIKKLSELDGQKSENKQKSRRFIFRLLKHATLEDEASISELVAKDDWETKIQIMKTRYLYRDVKFLNNKFIKSILDSFPVKIKAQILLLLDENLKNNYMSQLTDGSKQKEMLTLEMEQVANNDEQMAALLKQRQKILTSFMERIRSQVAKKDDIIKEAVLQQCEEFNIDFPSHLFAETEDSVNEDLGTISAA